MAFSSGSNDIDIIVKVDATGAQQAFDKLGNELKTLKSESDSSGSNFTKLESKFASIALGVGATGIAIGAFKKTLEFARQGDQVNDITESFERLSEKVGATSKTFLTDLASATNNTISNLDLMKSANDGLQAGLKPDALVQLAKAAKVLGDQVGKDTKQAFDDLTQAIETGRVATLKQYGVIVDADYVVNKYANSQNKLAKDIDEATKLQLIQAEAQRQLTEKLAGGAAGADGAGESLEQLDTAIKNLNDSFASFVDKNPILISAIKGVSSAFSGLAEVIKGVDVETFMQSILNATPIFGQAIASVNAAKTAVNALVGTEEKLSKSTFANLKAIEAEEAAREKATKLIEEEKKKQDALIKAKAAAIQATKDQAEALKKANQTFDENLSKLKDLASPTGLMSVYDAFKKTAESGRDLGLSSGQILDAFVKLRAEFISAGLSADTVDQIIIKLKNDLNNLGKTATDNSLGGLLGDLFGGDPNTINNILSASFSALEGAFSAKTGADFKKITADLAGSIANAFAPGTGPIASALTKGIFDLFSSGDSEGTKLRKAADKYFADIFDKNRLSIVINNQLKQITDLDFGGKDSGNAAKGFFDAFNNLGANAQGAFGGVARAFSELLGQSQEFAANLAAVFSNNLGGSLNNLQLLIEATGQSAQSLRQAVVDAFLDGKISALEAQTAINGINNAMKKGIPDAVGAVTQAFDNLKAAGTNGGRASTDALRDIGEEAKELKIKTFPELIAYLVKTGKYSSEEIAKVFDALKKAGIDTIDKLTNATDQKLIGVLSQLQAQDFPFAKAAQDAQKLIDTVTNLPKEIKTRLVFEVQVNGTKQDKDIVEKATAGKVGSSTAGRGA